MEKYAILLGYFDKQWKIIDKLQKQIAHSDLSSYEQRYVFALKAQQLYTAIEDLMKQTAKAFENHVESITSYHKELLVRLNTEIPKIRPALFLQNSFLMLDKLRAFRHFIRHAYDCELDQNELRNIQSNLILHFGSVERDYLCFRKFVEELSNG